MRVAAYYRVSTDEQAQEGYSLAAQERACREYCRQRDWTITNEYRDEGKSAHTDSISKRPAFHALLEAARTKQIDVIVVHKFDRFSRSMAVTVEAFRLLSQSGCGFVSITEQFDYTTAQGRLFLHMLAALADFYSSNLSTETSKGKRERRAQGHYNGVVPFGYRRVDGRDLEPDEVTAEGLRLAFAAAAAGRSDREIAEMLNAAGYRSTGNRGANPWRKDSVRRMLLSRFYLGELPLLSARPNQKRKGLDGWTRGKHPALIDEPLWQCAQEMRALLRKTLPSRCVNSRSQCYPLSGLLRCGHCQMAMRIHAYNTRPPRIVCYGRNQGLGCAQASVLYGDVEEQVTSWLFALPIDTERVDRTIERIRKSEPTPIAPESSRRQLEAQIARLRDLYELGDIARGDYLKKREALHQRLASVSPGTEKARRLVLVADRARGAQIAWERATYEERNGLLLVLVERVIITDQAVVIMPQPDLRELLC